MTSWLNLLLQLTLLLRSWFITTAAGGSWFWERPSLLSTTIRSVGESKESTRLYTDDNHELAWKTRMMMETNSSTNDYQYSAIYFGRYRYLLATVVDYYYAPWPELKAFCVGELSLIDTIPSVQCSGPTATNETGYGNEITCDTQVCYDSEDLCQATVGVAEDDLNRGWGTVAFQCSGDTIEDTKGAFSFEDNGDGKLGDTFIYDNLRLFRRAQLGVFCSDEDTADYLPDYFECSGEDGPYLGRRKGSSKRVPYICEFGKVCQDCTVDFRRVVIEADIHRFRPECFQASPGAPLELPDAPAPPPTPAGNYSIRYTAQWRMFEHNTATTCDYSDQRIVITCDPGSTIRVVDTLFGTVRCTQGNIAHELVCIDQGGDSSSFSTKPNFNDDYSGVIYECSGPTPPGTSFIKEAATESCSVVQDEGLFGTYIRLGISCKEGPGGTEFEFADHFLECMESDFSLIEDLGYTYICYTDTWLPETGDTVEFPQVATGTDHRLYEYAKTFDCFDFVSSSDHAQADETVAPVSASRVTEAPTALGIPSTQIPSSEETTASIAEGELIGTPGVAERGEGPSSETKIDSQQVPAILFSDSPTLVSGGCRRGIAATCIVAVGTCLLRLFC